MTTSPDTRSKTVERNEPGQAFSEELQKWLVQKAVWACCLNCKFWTMHSAIGETDVVEYEICGKYNQVPPYEVVVHGCCDWEVAEEKP